MPSQTERPRLGLRERKKAGTRAAIQRHALRLFREQGYEATTVGQIAGAADISESTFFRYFPTKEDVVRWDEFDPLLVEAIWAQPAGADQLSGPLRLLSDVMAERAGRQPDEFAVRTLVERCWGYACR